MDSPLNLSLEDPNIVNSLIQHHDQLEEYLHENNFLKLQSKLDYLLHFFIQNGQQMDSFPSLSAQLDSFLIIFRNLLRNIPQSVHYSIKLLLLRLIESRASKWRNEEFLKEFYHEKLPFIDTFPSPPIRHKQPKKRNTLRASKSAGDVSNMNNNYSNTNKPLKALKKLQFEEDILIKNTESGRVMGVKGRRVRMIEQLSNTVISFQKVSHTALNRLVHITGPSQESIDIAKNIIFTTIRDNVSPITDDLSASRDSLGPSSERTTESVWSIDSSSNLPTPAPEYRFNLLIKDENVTFSISSPQIGRYLEEFMIKNDFLKFIQNNTQIHKKSSFIYDRETLLSLQHLATPLVSIEIDKEFIKDNEKR